MRKFFVNGLLIAIFALNLVGCGKVGLATFEAIDSPGQESTDSLIEISEQEATKELIETIDKIEATAQPEVDDILKEPDYAQIKPDESGEIMIVMYHNLSEKNSSYARTIESFKGDLQRLNGMGFTSIRMEDYIDGNFRVEAGRTPVVLTFDDGHRSNFNYLDTPDGLIIDPDCVIGILDAFYEENPDFGRAAVFYLNAGNPFGQPKHIHQKLQYLLDQGYEIGNHAYNHEDLTILDATGIQRALGKNALHFNAINKGLVMESLALPYGKSPQIEDLRLYVIKGEYEGFGYHHHAVLRVGWKPYVPVYHVNFNGSGIHRVQSGDGDMQLTWWLDHYEESPNKRFISDGLTERISVPTSHLDRIDPDAIGDRELFEYTLED